MTKIVGTLTRTSTLIKHVKGHAKGWIKITKIDVLHLHATKGWRKVGWQPNLVSRHSKAEGLKTSFHVHEEYVRM